MQILKEAKIGKYKVVRLLFRHGKYGVKPDDEMAYDFDSLEEAEAYFEEYVHMRRGEENL